MLEARLTSASAWPDRANKSSGPIIERFRPAVSEATGRNLLDSDVLK